MSVVGHSCGVVECIYGVLSGSTSGREMNIGRNLKMCYMVLLKRAVSMHQCHFWPHEIIEIDLLYFSLTLILFRNFRNTL